MSFLYNSHKLIYTAIITFFFILLIDIFFFFYITAQGVLTVNIKGYGKPNNGKSSFVTFLYKRLSKCLGLEAWNYFLKERNKLIENKGVYFLVV